jgi:Dna[CI] antecedent DciA-like protein
MPSVRERRERGFERAGACGAGRLGLAKDLRLAAAWSSAAGEGIVRQVSGLRLRAGVLEVEVADRAWAGTLAALLPRLARAVAARDPDLGVVRCRLIVREGGATSRGPVQEL